MAEAGEQCYFNEKHANRDTLSLGADAMYTSIQELVLAKLEEGLPGISPSLGTTLAEASIICLHSHKHVAGVELDVQGMVSQSFKILWEKEVTDQLQRSWEDEQDCTELGACAIAILLILELTPYTVIRRARKGTGIDYWLGYRNTDLIFQDSARLEISGILSGDAGNVRSRVNQKKRQTKPSDGSLPAYVVVVEFSHPASHVVKK